MILYFIRHGQSSNNVLFSETQSHAGRQDDPALTKIGLQQAQRVGEFLVKGDPAGGFSCDERMIGFGITHLYTSLMLRAVQTANAIGECLNLQPVGLDSLHESGGVHLGDDTVGEVEPTMGKSIEFFRQKYPKLTLPADMLPDGWWGRRPYEVLAQRQARADKLLSFLMDHHGGTQDRVAIVSHGDFFNVFLSRVVGFPTGDGIWFSSHNTGISRIDFRDGRRRIVYQNRTAHLPPELLTA